MTSPVGSVAVNALGSEHPRPVDATGVAPGRVNLIGEHTDYNDGYVLPMPIPQQTRVHITLRNDNTIRLKSAQMNEEGRYELGAEKLTHSWIDYIQGVTHALITRGHVLRGFDAAIESQVPIGAGLSSSASLEVATLRALRAAFELTLDDVGIAQVGRAAEVDFVGVPIGIMDQMAASVGTQGKALFIDTRTLATREVRIPADLEVVVVASGVTHAHGTGSYRTRREECARAAKELGVASLRDLDGADMAVLRTLEPLLARRVRHVLTENERVLRTVEALDQGDAAQLGDLFAASHASMRDDFEITTPEIDLLVEIANTCPGMHAARMTGGGFGGSVVMLSEQGSGRRVAEHIAGLYAKRTGLEPSVLVPPAGDTHET